MRGSFSSKLRTFSLTRRNFLRFGGGVALALTVGGVGFASGSDLIAEKLKSPDVRQNLDGLTPGRKPQAPRLLMIDPGHGGHDPGAIGPSGVYEKEVTLDIARRMAEFLKPIETVEVRLTRSEDVFIPLPERVKIAQAAHADLFVSIHADSAPDRSARGLSTYTLSAKASDSFAGALATQENRIEAMGGVDLGQADQDVAAILMDLATRRTRETSQRARYTFVESVGRKWHLLERPMRGANFAVLRAPDIPSFLVETGFLSNRQDEALLAKPQERGVIARLMSEELRTILESPLFG